MFFLFFEILNGEVEEYDFNNIFPPSNFLFKICSVTPVKGLLFNTSQVPGELPLYALLSP